MVFITHISFIKQRFASVSNKLTYLARYAQNVNGGKTCTLPKRKLKTEERANDNTCHIFSPPFHQFSVSPLVLQFHLISQRIWLLLLSSVRTHCTACCDDGRLLGVHYTNIRKSYQPTQTDTHVHTPTGWHSDKRSNCSNLNESNIIAPNLNVIAYCLFHIHIDKTIFWPLEKKENQIHQRICWKNEMKNKVNHDIGDNARKSENYKYRKASAKRKNDRKKNIYVAKRVRNEREKKRMWL